MVHKKPTVPLIQVERADLKLREENLYALSLAGLSETQHELLTLTELVGFKPFPSHTFALVDHNRLGSAFTLDNPKAEVIAVVDHHEDEHLYPQANPRIISPSGSCTSHITALCPPELPVELATLLLTGILIDTDGLKPGGKAIDIDRNSALFLATKSTISNVIPPLSALSPIDHPNPDALYDCQAIKDLTGTLSTKKLDVSRLGALDLLRRDYKESTLTLKWAPGKPTIKAGLSSVPLRLKAWGSDGRLETDAVTWMQRRGITVLGVLTSFKDTKGNKFTKTGKGKHKKEMAWVVLEETGLSQIASSTNGLTVSVLAERLWKGLEANDQIKVKQYKKFDLQKAGKLPSTSETRAYKQRNVHASRKIIAPVLKEILEGPPTTSEVDNNK